MTGNPPPSRERRQSERVAFRGIAQLLVTGHPPLEVRTIDIGLGGIGGVVSGNLPANLACTVRVAIPMRPGGPVTIELRACVVHSILSGNEGGFKIGLQFVHLPASAESALKEFLRSRNTHLPSLARV
jgi:c-di-GMP-binding flagellar brake protein YcgR